MGFLRYKFEVENVMYFAESRTPRRTVDAPRGSGIVRSATELLAQGAKVQSNQGAASWLDLCIYCTLNEAYVHGN